MHQFTIRVTATQTDADSSEFIDRIEIGGDARRRHDRARRVNPGTEPDQLIQEFVVTLPPDTDINFPLTITAVSKETSNGDEESNSAIIDIVNEFNSTTTGAEFTAQTRASGAPATSSPSWTTASSA